VRPRVITESSFDRYRRLLATNLPNIDADDLEPENLLADLGVDSVLLVQLVVQLEEAFDLNMPDEAMSAETFESVESLWLVIGGLLENAHHG
jgi:acyl carrier protein